MEKQIKKQLDKTLFDIIVVPRRILGVLVVCVHDLDWRWLSPDNEEAL